MRSVSFFLDHAEGDSRALAEFHLENGRPTLLGLVFIRGNVISLPEYRKCLRQAGMILREEKKEEVVLP